MKVVVAGGSGFLGRHISRSLLDGGHDVAVLGRNPAKLARIPQLEGARPIQGDVTDASSLQGKLDGADAVVGVVQFPNYPMELPRKGLTFHRYEFHGTRNLLRAAREAGVERYVYISGAGADPRSDKTWYRAKGLAEHEIRASGIDHAFLRPSWGYGPEDKALNKYVLLTRLSPVIPYFARFENGRPKPQLIQPVYVGDIALAVQRVFERGAWNATFEIGGPDVVSMADVVRTLLRVLGKKRLVLPFPASLAKLAVAPLVLLPQPPMSPRGVDFAIQDGLVDQTSTREVLGVEPLPLEAGLRRYLGSART